MHGARTRARARRRRARLAADARIGEPPKPPTAERFGLLALVTVSLAVLACGREPPPPRPPAGPSPLTASPRGVVTASVTAAELRRHVVYLADPRLDGRGPDGRGLALALDYVERELRGGSLGPALGDAPRVRFSAPGSTRLGDATALEQRGGRTFRVGRDYVPFAFSSTGTWTAPIAFVARGIVRSALAVDDYAGLDVRGRIVVLSSLPDALDEAHPGRLPSIYARVAEARRRGAVAALVIRERLALPPVQPHAPPLGIAALQITAPTAERLLGLPRGGLAALSARRVERPPVSLRVSLVRDAATLEHVVVAHGEGDLRGAIWVSANVEHLGLGGWPSRGGTDRRVVHPGACESASGVAALLEIARAFGRSAAPRERRPIVFAFVSGDTATPRGRSTLARDAGPGATWIDLGTLGCARRRAVLRGATPTPLDGVVATALEARGMTLDPSPSALSVAQETFAAAFAGPTLALTTDPDGEALRPSDTVDRVHFGPLSSIAGAMIAALDAAR
jgi:hypothetical protein